jgi:Tfp pilus assembly protein PilO
MNLRTPAATKALGAIALLLLVAAGWMFVVGPKSDALAQVREQIQISRDQNAGLEQQLLLLRKQVAELDETRQVADALAEKFPPTADQPGMFGEVTEAATEAGIPARDVTALTPTTPTVGGADATAGVTPQTSPADVARQTVTVSVEGSYAQTHNLLENLEEISRAYVINSVSLVMGENGFTTTIIGEMFAMPPAKDPGPELDEAS